jgi:hypothetical protein
VINGLILKMAEIRLGRPAPPAFMQILAGRDHPPLVIVASGLDDFERRVSQKYAPIVGPNAQVWLIADAWHLGGLVVAPEAYRQRMLAFFEAAFDK